MRTSNRWAIIAVQLLSILQLSAAEKARVPVALEGYVRDTSGKPVQGVLVMVSEGSHTTQGETSVIPLIFPRVAGAVIINDPDVIQVHDYNTHFTKTNSKGYYVFKELSPRRYRFSASGQKKSWGDMRTHTENLVANKNMLAKYKFPPDEVIVINGGETIVRNLVLQPSKLTAVCSVPKPSQPEDAKFIDGFAAKAAHGDAEAMLMIGYAYQHGQHGVAPDNAQAACWFRRVAVKGGYSVKTEKASAEASRSLRQLHETIY